MIESAIDAYISACPERSYGVCSTIKSRLPLDDNFYSCLGRDCLLVKEFIEKLEKDGK